MREVEVKILEIDEDKIEKRIVSLGGKFIESVLLVDDFFDFPDMRLAKNHEFLRVRCAENRKEITFKCKREDILDFKAREEMQTAIGDASVFFEILEKLGMERIRHAEKMRTSYTLDNVRIEIDKYPKIPPFLEIEGINEDSVRKAVEKLGFRMSDTTSRNGAKILWEYGIKGNDVRF
ncbi:MAG: class IV adenylate cyclase [Candidatus Micrarchaeota archaeon]|nr:class IV adenylate cyclase [Candidatus Micrarchaeota archaeon]